MRFIQCLWIAIALNNRVKKYVLLYLNNNFFLHRWQYFFLIFCLFSNSYVNIQTESIGESKVNLFKWFAFNEHFMHVFKREKKNSLQQGYCKFFLFRFLPLPHRPTLQLIEFFSPIGASVTHPICRTTKCSDCHQNRFIRIRSP